MHRLHAVLVSTVLGLWESKWESGIKPGSVSSSLAHPQPLCLNAEKDGREISLQSATTEGKGPEEREAGSSHIHTVGGQGEMGTPGNTGNPNSFIFYQEDGQTLEVAKSSSLLLFRPGLIKTLACLH